MQSCRLYLYTMLRLAFLYVKTTCKPLTRSISFLSVYWVSHQCLHVLSKSWLPPLCGLDGAHNTGYIHCASNNSASCKSLMTLLGRDISSEDSCLCSWLWELLRKGKYIGPFDLVCLYSDNNSHPFKKKNSILFLVLYSDLYSINVAYRLWFVGSNCNVSYSASFKK